MIDAKYWIEKLELKAHPEGGFYREIYRNPLMVKAKGFNEEKNAATSIYYLLEKNNRSHFHRLKSDEIWYYHVGGPLNICLFDTTGKYSEVKLGCNIENHERLQVIIPAGYIFGAYLPPFSEYILMGCMVDPGFSFSDFELMKKEEMIELFPGKINIIEILC